jgi:hypothetical protein
MRIPVGIRLYLALYILGISVAGIVSIWQSSPGYMDADYYYGGAIQQVTGQGFWEPYIWNYLSDPAGLPQPAFTYWMPLPSIIAALGMYVGGEVSFTWAKVFFIGLFGLVPVLSAYTAKRYFENQRYAWVSGLLGAIPGIYLAYISLPETFILYMLGGTSVFLLLRSYDQNPGGRQLKLQMLMLGLCVGWMHLSRADGILWLLGIVTWLIVNGFRQKDMFNMRIATQLIGFIFLGTFL